MLLEISNLTKNFGGLAAISQLDMYVKEGEIVGLIGPNGAGKSTLFNLITGVHSTTSGKVMFNKKDITGKAPHMVAKLGIGRTFQLTPLFADFTTLENVLASFYLHPKSTLWDAFFNTPVYRRNEKYCLEQSLEILQMVGLDIAKNELAKNLPHGYQKMLGVARALAVKPKLLLLDEPIAGMNREEVTFAMKAIEKIRQQGITILLVDHNMRIMGLCDRVIVINFGKKIAEGSPDEIRMNTEVVRAYLGTEYVT